MKQSVGFNRFCDAFTAHGRDNNFSYEGKRALFDYLEELGDNIGEEIELDVVALCGEYTEWEDLEEFHGNYDKEDYPDFDTIRDHTIVIEFGNNGGFITQDF